MSECPGEGLCERFTGVAGDTDEEKFEEASPGCPKKCQSLRVAADNNSICETEDKILLSQIENLFNENRVFPFSTQQLADLEYFESECLIFWHKTVADFEREVGVTLRILAEGFFKK